MPAVEEIWRYRDEVGRLAQQLCRHREDAEDVAQATLLKAVEHLHEFRGEASVRTWLHRIAANECRMLRRRPATVSLEQLLEAEASDEETPPLELPDDAPTPEEIAIETEMRRIVAQALEGLPDRYRTVLLLKDGEGLREKEVAKAMGLSLSAVKALLHRARRALRKQVQRRTDLRKWA
ncbi:ECF RNA polymerase sigma factor SigW [bacterium HR17]|uniref:ECF RNA polymerase sigma factor SigW n=1 Tax=Candidatus Fervidibacter japonicus TaxID=2035412 RepID=A0A2H5XAJ2_9BACT|nr:ECF RNA polymerase sigma factor SigW [bacterium HR17]